MSTKYCVINMNGIVMPRETRTKITFLAGAIMCCIVAMLFYSNYSGSENHIIASAFAASVDKASQNQPNIQGSNIYQTQTLVLGKNVKNLLILIPNEGHEDPQQPKG